MNDNRVIIVDEITRLDKFIFENTENLTRSKIQNLILNGNILVNSKLITKNYKTKIGDKVEIMIPEPTDIDVKSENIPLDIVYEDEHILVVNKAKGMVVHPAPGNYEGTLVNALLYHCKGSLSGINGKIRPGIVHRIDKDTSGLLVVAKSDIAHNGLAEQIKAHSIKREYRAVVYGKFKDYVGKVDAPIGRSHKDRKQMAVVQEGRNAVTHYEMIERFNGFSYIKLILETGRTHQIRVHMSYLGKPVAGDPLYGPKAVITELKGQCLHAQTLGFVHPINGEYLEFSSELPEVFLKFLNKLKQ